MDFCLTFFEQLLAFQDCQIFISFHGVAETIIICLCATLWALEELYMKALPGGQNWHQIWACPFFYGNTFIKYTNVFSKAGREEFPLVSSLCWILAGSKNILNIKNLSGTGSKYNEVSQIHRLWSGLANILHTLCIKWKLLGINQMLPYSLLWTASTAIAVVI